MPVLPEPRGPLSAAVLSALSGSADLDVAFTPPAEPLGDDDLQLALYCCYELHFRGFDGVDDRWEWDPGLLTLRRAMEDCFERALLDLVGAPGPAAAPEEMDVALRAIADADDAPSVSRYVERHATMEQVLELLAQRSPYQLKEADPHTFAIPRLNGPPKAAFVEIQADEYGGGRGDRIHSTLFANAMEALGLDATYGAYLDCIPGTTLAPVNLNCMLGLHRRWRGACAGHLALFEMGSSVPNSRYARGLRRLGAPEAALDFFDEHVLADAVHENIAAVDLAGGLARQEPELCADILWGARALIALDGLAARPMMAAWEEGVSSLRRPLPSPLPA